jgi:glycosyltransferase involved in cell wall biosynthesis
MILFLDKVLMGERRGQPRGVELFNLNLIRDLAALNMSVAVPAHITWAQPIEQTAASDGVEILPLRGAWSLARRRYSTLLLANVANRLISHLAILRLRRAAPRCVLVAHREPTWRSLRAQKMWPSTVVAVNRQIAGRFERAGFRDVAVYYGIGDADRFHPPPVPSDEDGCVRFCVAGDLDNAWKGADTAVAAFRMLPENVAHRCELHLASFRQPPDFGDARIRTYAWMEAAAMPDFFRRMAVMIVPSRDERVMRETFSQVMVQGMLTQLPTLVNRLPILMEKIDCGGGLVFRDARELSAAMARLVNDAGERRRLGRIARRTALERYVWNTETFARRFGIDETPVSPGM